MRPTSVYAWLLILVIWVGRADISKCEESIYGIRRGPFDPTDQYVTTYEDNKIYIHVLDWKGKNNISLPSITDRIVKKAWIMGDPPDADYSWGFIRQHPWGLFVVVPEDRQHQPDTIVVLEIGGEISELIQPRIIDADPSLAIFLMGNAAKLIGGLEYNPGPDWIEGWRNSSQSATWRVRVPQSGDYELSMIYACLPDSEDSEFEIVTGKSKVTHALKKTEGWAGELQNFEEKSLEGKLHLAAGINIITIGAINRTGIGEAMKLYALKLISPVVKQAMEVAQERAIKLRASTDWLVAAKYGVMFHWMPSTQPKRGLAKPFPAAVRDFDVNAFADMVQETGAGYVIFTAPHGIQWFPGPIQMIENILPGRTCARDLIGDMADALEKRGIKLILYYHHGVGDHQWVKASGFLNKDKSQFFKNEANILTEIGLRYGKKVAGFWFDDRNPMQPFEKLYRATKAGNPDRIVAWNSWVLPTSTEFQDYYAGEFGGALILPDTSYFGKSGPAGGLQPHGMIFLDDSWHHGHLDTDIEPPRFATKQLVDYVKKCIASNLVITMNMGIYQDGSASAATLAQMRSLRQVIRGK